MIFEKKIWLLLALSAATLVAADDDGEDPNDFLTPFEIHKLRAMKVSQVVPPEPPARSWISEQVYGGSEGNETMPFMAYIWSFNAQNRSVHNCSGVIVNQSFVLTAAQCFERANWSMVTVGSIDRTSASARNIYTLPTQWVIHKEFVYNGLVNDIALVNLTSNPLVLSSTIAVMPLCCPSTYKKKEAIYNRTVIVYGYGKNTVVADPDCPVPDGPAYVFNTAQLPMSNSSSFCKSQLREHYITMSKTHACTASIYNRTTGACDADSGGPVVMLQGGSLSPCLAGITSLHGFETCPNTYPITVTDMQGLTKWVQDTTKMKPLKC